MWTNQLDGGALTYIAANNEEADNRRSYWAQLDKERKDIVIMAHEGHAPELSEEVVFEEHFTPQECLDLMRSMRDALETTAKFHEALATMADALKVVEGA